MLPHDLPLSSTVYSYFRLFQKKERLGAIAFILEDLEELSELKLIWVDNEYSGQNFARVVGQLCKADVEVSN